MSLTLSRTYTKETDYCIHRVLHTLSTAHTEYCIHRVLHHSKINCLLLAASLSSGISYLSSPDSHLSVDLVVLTSLHSHDDTFTIEYSLSCCRTSLVIYCLQMNHHQVLQSWSITDSKCISKLARSGPPGASLITHSPGLQFHLKISSVMASKFSWSGSPNVSPNSPDHGLQVHLSVHLTSGSKCNSKFPRSQCGETTELEGSEPIVNTLPHLSQHPKGIHRNEQFWFKDMIGNLVVRNHTIWVDVWRPG